MEPRFEQIPQISRKRRRVDYRSKGCVYSDVVLVLSMASLLPALTIAEPLYDSCFQSIRAANTDGDSALNRAEFDVFLTSMSGDAILPSSDLPSYITDPYSLREDAGTLALDIAGVVSPDDPALSAFCHDMYKGLFIWTEKSVSSNGCVLKLQAADTNPVDGNLSPEEYIPFLTVLTNTNFTESFDELPSHTLSVFNDMSVEGEILGSRGREYLLEFCERALVAVEINDRTETVADTAPTTTTSMSPIQLAALLRPPTPTVSPTAVLAANTLLPTASLGTNQPVGITELPTQAASTNMPTDALTESPTAPETIIPTVGAFEISTAQYASCKTGLIISDTNRDDRLDPQEYFRLVNRLSSNQFTGETYSTLDILFQETYESLSANQDAPDLQGSKPGKTPTDEQSSNLLDICTETYAVLARYELQGPSSVDEESVPTAAPKNETISAAVFSTCKISMVLSDLNRNNLLDQGEYVRFINRMLPDGEELSELEWTRLDPVLQDGYDEAASGGEIDVTGSKPGQSPSTTQLQHLETVCAAAQNSIEKYMELGPSSTPPGLNPTASPLEDDSLSDESFRVCKTAMLIADLDRDDLMSETEYVRLLNRLTLSQFSGLDFSGLDIIFQDAFNTLRGEKTIDIFGSKPGTSPTIEELKGLRNVCLTIHKAIAEYDALTAAPEPTGQPSSASTDGKPTMSTADINASDLIRCKAALVSSDENNDLLLNQEEFLEFANELSDRQFSTFGDLRPELQSLYNTSSSDDGSIPIEGIFLQENDSTFQPICSLVFATAAILSEDVQTATQCIEYLKIVDTDSNYILDREEYTELVGTLSNSSIGEFSQIPFVLQENFEWISLDSEYVVLEAPSNDSNFSVGDNQRLQWICSRTSAVIDSISSEGADNTNNATDHCEFSLSSADQNSDKLLNETEYIQAIRLYTLEDWPGLDFTSLSEDFKIIFEDEKVNADATTIEVDAAVDNGFCASLEEAAALSRDSEIFFNLCSLSLAEADGDRNGRVDESEYVPFLFQLANAYDTTATQVDLVPFENLSTVLQLTFEVLSLEDEFVRIGDVIDPSHEDIERRRWICSTTKEVIGLVTSEADVSVSVYNSFLLSRREPNVAGILSEEHRKLGEAYISFVYATADKDLISRSRNLRTRALVVDGVVPSSPVIYKVEDIDCSAHNENAVSCQKIYGIFELALSDEGDPMSVSNFYSDITQHAIDQGELQKELALIDPNATISVLHSSLPLQPQTSGGLFVPSGPPSDTTTVAQEETSGNISASLIVGALISLCIFALFYYCCFILRKRLKANKSENKKDNGIPRTDAESDDSSTKSSKGKLQAEDDSSYSRKNSDRLKISAVKDIPEQRPDEPVARPSTTEGSEKSTSDSDSDHDFEALSAKFNMSSEDFEIRVDSSSSSDNSSASDTSMPKNDESSSNNSWANNVQQSDFNSSNDSLVSDMNKLIEIADVGKKSAPTSDAMDVVEHDASAKRLEEQKKDLESTDHSSSAGEEDDIDSQENESESMDDWDEDDAQDKKSTLEKLSNHEKSGHNSLHESDDDMCFLVEGSDDDSLVSRLSEIGQEYSSDEEAETLVNSTYSINSADLREAYEKYRPIITELVAQVVPDEIDNVDAMIEQFLGREEELIETLENMAGTEGSEDPDGESFGEDSGPDVDSEDEDMTLDSDAESAEEIEEESIGDSDEIDDKSVEYEDETGSGEYEEASQTGSGEYEEGTEGSGEYEEASQTGSEEYEEASETGSGEYEEASQSGSGEYEEASETGSGEYEEASQSGSGEYEEDSETGSGEYEDESIDSDVEESCAG